MLIAQNEDLLIGPGTGNIQLIMSVLALSSPVVTACTNCFNNK
jgi:hypothetical protein